MSIHTTISDEALDLLRRFCKEVLTVEAIMHSLNYDLLKMIVDLSHADPVASFLGKFFPAGQLDLPVVQADSYIVRQVVMAACAFPEGALGEHEQLVHDLFDALYLDL